MKYFLLACVVAAASACYTDVDDKVDITSLDNNDEEMKKYFACYLDKGPCTLTMLSYKKHIAQSFHNACADCTPLQKHIGEEFIKTASVKFPDLVKELQMKYDPQGKDFKKLLNEFSKYDY